MATVFWSRLVEARQMVTKATPRLTTSINK